MKGLKLFLLILAIIVLGVTLSSCMSEGDDSAKDSIYDEIQELEARILDNKSSFETEIAQLKAEYDAELAKLSKTDADNTAAIDALTKSYNNKILALEEAYQEDEKALLELKVKLEEFLRMGNTTSDLFDQITVVSERGNFNNAEIVMGGYETVVGSLPSTFSSTNIIRSSALVPAIAGKTMYAIFEGITTKYMTLICYDSDQLLLTKTTLYAKNLATSNVEYMLPEKTAFIAFYITGTETLECGVGLYYTPYEATTVEKYSYGERYIDGTKIVKNGSVFDIANAKEIEDIEDRIGYDEMIKNNIPQINSSDTEYGKHIIDAVRGEMANLWKYLAKKYEVTVLDSGVCGENLTWTLYSDGLLKISGTGRAYDYCKGLFGDKITRAEIEAYQAQYVGLTDDDSVAKYERGFQEGKFYDDEHGQYVAPWYKYRPETSFIEEGGDYTSRADYDRDNPNGWTYNRIEIDEGITYLGNWMFYRVCGATELVIPSTVTAIGQWCIRYSPSLKCIYLPDGITTIEKRGCSRNEVAEVIRLGEGFTTIGDYAFAQNPMIENLHIKGNVTSMGKNPFYGDVALKTITFDGLTEIDGVWLVECNNLERVQFSEGLTSISGSAFVNKANLTTVNIPSTVTSIGQSAFYGCTSLEYLYIDSPIVAQGLVDAASSANFGHVNYYAKYIYIKSEIKNVGAWFEKYCEKYGDIDGYTLYVRK